MHWKYRFEAAVVVARESKRLRSAPRDPRVSYPSYKSLDAYLDVARLRSLDGYLEEKIRRHMESTRDLHFHTGAFRHRPWQRHEPGARVISLTASERPFDYSEIDKEEYWQRTEHADEFAELMQFIDALPFTSIGRAMLIYDVSGRASTAHRDHSDTELCQDFVWFRTNERKRFYVMDGETRRQKPVESYSAWFDTVNQFHGSRAADGLTYAVRVDGVFTPEFRARIPRPQCNPASTPSLWAALGDAAD